MEEKWEGYVNWRNKPALKGKHGGMLAASFVLVVEVMENMAFLANASNLVLYLVKYMHFSLSNSAITVTNFMGTAFFLALLGGFLSDAFFTSYTIFILSAFIEFLGLVILTTQAHLPSLKPPSCEPNSLTNPCQIVQGGKAAMLFIGLYMTALGIGELKGLYPREIIGYDRHTTWHVYVTCHVVCRSYPIISPLPAHGAEQFDEGTPLGRKQRSTFFNYFVFSLSCGGLIAVTFVVWVEDNKGWEWGFGISTLSVLLSIPTFVAGSALYRNKVPSGSPLTTIFKVFLAAVLNKRKPKNTPSNAIASMSSDPSLQTEIQPSELKFTGQGPNETPTKTLSFLNRAITDKSSHRALHCTVQQVEDVKIVLKMMPIFGCTIMLNCCLAQLSTYSIEQAATMNTKLGSLKIPPGSLPVFPVVFIMIMAPIYDHVIVPLTRKMNKTEMGITHLQRIGTGLILSIVAMAIAALVEVKRKHVAIQSGLVETKEALPITFFWIAFQFLFLGSADLFTLAGLLEFFFTEAPSSMRSLATSLSWASLAVGYYLSSVIISIVNSVTGISSHRPWLSGHNLNHYRLDLFYWLMCVLSVINFFIYLFCASRYKYRSTSSSSQ